MENFKLAHYTREINSKSIKDNGLKKSIHINEGNNKKCMFLGDGYYFFDYNCKDGYKIGRSMSIDKSKRSTSINFSRFSLAVEIEKNSIYDLNSETDRAIIESYFNQYKKNLINNGVEVPFDPTDITVILEHIERFIKFDKIHYGWALGYMINEFLKNVSGYNPKIIRCKFVTNEKNKEGVTQYNVRDEIIVKNIEGPDILNSMSLVLD